MDFYSTYEELKQNRHRTNIKDINNFYSTYEELKPHLLCWGDTPQTPFLLYLWGIETIIMISLWYHFAITFLLYLWGIETANMSVILRLYIYFYSTYEELKLFFEFITYFPFYYFYSTYEELKQFLWTYFSQLKKTFLLYLWGIETCKSLWGTQSCLSHFYSTYEELKHTVWS